MPDGEPIRTPGSDLLPVLYCGKPGMLKIAHDEEERLGGVLMNWWEGEGAARVFAHDDHALLLERATGPRSLSEMARTGQDDEASLVICSVAARLHAHRAKPMPELVPLRNWFAELWPAASKFGGIFQQSAMVASELLNNPQEPVVLHGDLHHGNVLDGERGWIAIDPKRVHGERGYDFANIFCNPDDEVALAPGRLIRQLDVVSHSAGMNRTRLLKWILAYAGLSAAWSIGSPHETPDLALAVARLSATTFDVVDSNRSRNS